MKEEKKTSRKNNKRRILIAIAVIVWVVAIGLLIKNNMTTQIYCHYENEFSDLIPRHECANIRVVSDSLREIDMDSYFIEGVDVTCYSSIKKLPDCSGEEYHFLELPLDYFCVEDCNVSGTLCAGYAMDFYNASTEGKEDYLQMFTDKYITQEEINQKLKECGKNG